MTRSLAVFLSGCVLAQIASVAQVTVKLKFEQDRFLPEETMEATVRVTNFTGQTLNLGQGAEWLSFDIQAGDDRFVSKWSDPPVEGAFELDNAMVGIKRVNLAPYFDLSRPGEYKVTAAVYVPQLGVTVRSEPASVSIVKGTELWGLRFGVPRLLGDGLFDVRRYALIQVTHHRSMVLYFRLTDASETRTLAVFPLGRMVSFTDPEAQIDEKGRLHILYQSGARGFFYYRISPDGEIDARQTFMYTDSRPRLIATPGGKIKVAGGARNLRPDDINPTPAEDPVEPEPEKEPSTDAPVLKDPDSN